MIVRTKTTDERILDLIIAGSLELREGDSREPEVWSLRASRQPKKLTVRAMHKGRRRQDRLMLEVWLGDGKVTICYPRLVWMIDCRILIPPGFEIHHRDEDYNNNAVDNLICLFDIDHRKFHRKYADEVF